MKTADGDPHKNVLSGHLILGAKSLLTHIMGKLWI